MVRKIRKCRSFVSSINISEEETERSSTSPTPNHEATPPPPPITQEQSVEHESDVE